jgi:hypothetical protein
VCASPGRSTLPSIEPQSTNIEVLAAWDSVIKCPSFKVDYRQSFAIEMITEPLSRTPTSMFCARRSLAEPNVTGPRWLLTLNLTITYSPSSKYDRSSKGSYLIFNLVSRTSSRACKALWGILRASAFVSLLSFSYLSADAVVR